MNPDDIRILRSVQLKTLTITRFKSLRNCQLSFTSGVTVLVGKNGSGKSEILEALSFLQALFRGRVSEWLQTHLYTSGNQLLVPVAGEGANKASLEFSAVYEYLQHRYLWHAVVNLQNFQCYTEAVSELREPPVEFQDPVLRAFMPLSANPDVRLFVQPFEMVTPGKTQAIVFHYEGSVLSALEYDQVPQEVRVFGDFMRRLVTDEADLKTLTGDWLGAIPDDPPEVLNGDQLPLLQTFFPRLSQLDFVTLPGGWQHLAAAIKIDGEERWCPASPALLRMVVTIHALQSSASFVALDGADAVLAPALKIPFVNLLQSSRKPVMLATHDMLTVNQVRPEAVLMVSRDKQGTVSVVPLCDVPDMKARLEVLAPRDAILEAGIL